jgi:hypothetical protein
MRSITPRSVSIGGDYNAEAQKGKTQRFQRKGAGAETQKAQRQGAEAQRQNAEKQKSILSLLFLCASAWFVFESTSQNFVKAVLLCYTIWNYCAGSHARYSVDPANGQARWVA